ncbi:Uncharacterised protein [Vibrio cholerae]|nr:Uncharacterised protein [Vibrio cholerae]
MFLKGLDDLCGHTPYKMLFIGEGEQRRAASFPEDRRRVNGAETAG